MDTGQNTGGYEAELKEAERAETQERTTAYGHRKRGEIVTVDDYRLWKRKKRELERRRDEN